MKCHVCTEVIWQCSPTITPMEKEIQIDFSKFSAFSADKMLIFKKFFLKQWPSGCCTSKAAPSWCAEISGEIWDLCTSALLPAWGSLCVYLCTISPVPSLMLFLMLKYSHTKWEPSHTHTKWEPSHTHTKWEPSHTHTHKTPPPYPLEFFVESANRLVNCKMGVSYEKWEALPALNKANSLSMKPAFCAHSLLPLGLWLVGLLFLLPLCNIIWMRQLWDSLKSSPNKHQQTYGNLDMTPLSHSFPNKSPLKYCSISRIPKYRHWNSTVKTFESRRVWEITERVKLDSLLSHFCKFLSDSVGKMKITLAQAKESDSSFLCNFFLYLGWMMAKPLNTADTGTIPMPAKHWRVSNFQSL